MRWPRPWRGRNTLGWLPSLPNRRSSDGSPNGDETLTHFWSVSPSRSYRPLPPTIPITLEEDMAPDWSIGGPPLQYQSPGVARRGTVAAMPRPALLLDRDGVINVEVEYLRDPARVSLLPGAAAAIARANAAGIPVVVVTNQSGLARG